jgi:DNA-binding transcriptional LysR family regulator
LTTAGTAAVPLARAALASVDAMRKAVDDVTGLIRGRLVVGMVVGCRVTPLFDALAALHLEHPGVEIALIEDNSDRLVELVRNGEADFVLIATAAAPPAGLDGFAIVSERLVAAVPHGHPLAKRRRATLADITGYPIVCLPIGTGIRTVFDEACAARGIRPDVSFQASAPDTVADLAARGLGVAVLSVSTVAGQHDRLHIVPIDDVETPAVLALIWTATVSPALHELVRYSRAAFGRTPE